MIARFDGTCARCDGKISKGEEIKWNRKKRGVVYHPVCPNGVTDALDSHVPDFTQGFTDKSNEPWIESASTADISAVYEKYGRTEDVRDAMEQLTATDFNELYPIAKTETKTETKTAQERTETMNTTHVNGNNGDGLAAMLASALQSHLNTSASVDAEQVREIVKSELAGMGALPTRVEIKVSETVTRDMGVQHNQFPDLLISLSAEVNVWLAGPAGSGKTTAAEKCAEALGINFYFCGAQSNEYGLLGFKTATGETVKTAFREAFEFGGVFLFDEVDASASSALLAFNAALANGICAFPDGMVRRHPKFIAVAAANTYGLGGNNDYVGRMKQDAAFLDRFVFMQWDIDEALETAIAGNIPWTKYVQAVRARVKAKQIKVVISPRASIFGAKLLAKGMDIEKVKKMTLAKGMDKTQWKSVA